MNLRHGNSNFGLYTNRGGRISMFVTCYIIPEDVYYFKRYTATGANVAMLQLDYSNYYYAYDILNTIMFYIVFKFIKNEIFHYFLICFILQTNIGQLYFQIFFKNIYNYNQKSDF